MGQIDLKQNQGVRTTDLPSGGISDTTAYAMRGMNALDRANDRLASGMKHVSDALFGVTKDMVATRDRVEGDTAQIEIFKMEDADNKKMEAEILAGRIKTPEQFEEAYNKLYASRETKINKYLENNVSSERNAEFLSLGAKGKSATNYAHMAGVFQKFQMKNVFNKAQENVLEFARSGGSNAIDGIEKSADSLRGMYSEDVVKGLKREGVLEHLKVQAQNIASIENDKDRQDAINAQLELYANGVEDASVMRGLEFLKKLDREKLHSAYLDMSKKNAENIANKQRNSSSERIAKILEAKGKERDLRIKAFDKFVAQSPYLKPEDRIKAKDALQRGLLAQKAATEKAENDAIKLQNLNFKTHTKELFVGKADPTETELANIQKIKTAAKSAFAVPDIDDKGKIVLSVKDKQDATLLQVQDEIDSYDEDTDTTGEYGRALLYKINALFTDVPEIAENLPEGEPEFIKETTSVYMGIPTVVERKNPKWTGFSEAEIKTHNADLDEKRKVRGNLIYNPQVQERLKRELGERMGIFANASIKAESVKEYVKPIFDESVGKSFKDLKPQQQGIYTQLKQAFVRRAMTAGLNDERELGEWVNKSPYVATMREKLKLLKNAKDGASFDTSFAYAHTQISKAPNLLAYSAIDSGISAMETAYLKMKSKRDQELSKEEK